MKVSRFYYSSNIKRVSVKQSAVKVFENVQMRVLLLFAVKGHNESSKMRDTEKKEGNPWGYPLRVPYAAF